MQVRFFDLAPGKIACSVNIDEPHLDSDYSSEYFGVAWEKADKYVDPNSITTCVYTD